MMSENINKDNISEDFKKLPATQYDIMLIRSSLSNIETTLQEIKGEIKSKEVLQTTNCGYHLNRTSDLETNVEKLDKRLSKVEKYLYIGFGAIVIIQFAAPFLIKLIWH